MRKLRIALILSIFLLTISFGCEEEVIEIDPTKIILGKWEIIEIGNWSDTEPVEEPNGYQEYLPDSIYKSHEYSTGNLTIRKYWIVDSMLHVRTVREDGFKIDIRYKYQFYDNNSKMRLDIDALAIYNTCIYKRIN